MQEYEYVNTGNLARLRTAMRIMQECVFLDEIENKKCQSVLHDICGLEFHTNNKIKIAPQNAVEENGHNAQHLQAASGCLSCRHDACCVYSWRPVVVDGVSCWQPPTAMQ